MQTKRKKAFYEVLASTVCTHRKSVECLIIMGDLSGKVGTDCEDEIVGPHGLGQRYDHESDLHTGKIPADFLQNIFIPFPKVQGGPKKTQTVFGYLSDG